MTESFDPTPLADLEPTWRYPIRIKDPIRDIAEKTHISFSTVQAQMQGRVKPSLTLVMRLSLVYGVPLEDLVQLALTNDRVRIRPADRGRAVNGHAVIDFPVWHPKHTNPKYPGMTPETAQDEKWRKQYDQSSPNLPDYEAMGMPPQHSLAYDWWQYRMRVIVGDFDGAGMWRSNIELSPPDGTPDDEVDLRRKLMFKRSQSVAKALREGCDPELLDVRAALAKARAGKSKGKRHK